MINNSNVLTLGENIVGVELACWMVDVWLKTRFQEADTPDWLRKFWGEAVEVIGQMGAEA